MKNIKKEALLWAQLGGFVLVWVTLLYATGTGLTINWDAVKKLPDAVTIYVALAFVFTKWLWRLKVAGTFSRSSRDMERGTSKQLEEPSDWPTYPAHSSRHRDSSNFFVS